jgi:tetratricopeptide (TPR) repeat protein/predicted Ser/Thr protein kinase
MADHRSPMALEKDPKTSAFDETGAIDRALEHTDELTSEDTDRSARTESTLALRRGSAVHRYVILDRLGAGGMGEVFSAYDPELDRKIALKLLRADRVGDDREAATRLLREAQAMARLSHVHVITVYDVGTFGEQVFIAMEFVEGGTLGKWIEECARDWRDVLRAFVKAGHGLAAAHAAGLVHRDFKPENVLLGKDGRVRVADFGLARPLSATTEPIETNPESLDRTEISQAKRLLLTPLTQAGAFLGTPAYMAPEQHLGDATDERSDQFSFCVSLYHGLYGELPFAGGTLSALRQNVIAGRVRDASRGTRVPLWLRRALLRGLRVSKDDRYASMDALLAALERDPRRVWRRALLAASLCAVVAGGVVAYDQMRSRENLVCRGAERKLAGVWDDRRKEDVQRALLATGKPFAQGAWQGVSRTLDAYAQSWAAQHTDACESTHIRGEQSTAVLDLRMRCLSQRRRELGALVELLARADASLAEKAVQAAERLRGVDGCADVADLSAPVRPPTPEVRREVDTLLERIAKARALRLAGRYQEARDLAARAVGAARATSYAPIIAEVLTLLGVAEKESGRAKEAADALDDASIAAEEGRHDDALARARIELVHVVGKLQGRPKEGHRLARHAAAAIARLGGDDELESRLHRYVGILLREQGKLDETRDRYTRALTLQRRRLGDAHIDVGWSLNNLGNVLADMGRPEEALDHFDRAIALWTALVGAEHPLIAVGKSNRSAPLRVLGRHAEAFASVREAYELGKRTFGIEHHYVLQFANNLALAAVDVGDFATALRHQQRTLTLQEKRFGAEHVEAFFARINLGELLFAAGRVDEAAAHHERALMLLRKLPSIGTDHAYIAHTLEVLSEARIAQGRASEGLRLAQEGLAMRERVQEPGHRDIARARVRLAEAFVAAGDLERGQQAARKARANLLGGVGSATDIARADFALARALWAQSSRRAESRVLAQSARDAYRRAGGRFVEKAKRVSAWLSAR